MGIIRGEGSERSKWSGYLEVDALLNDTKKAVQVLYQGYRIWLPKSKIEIEGLVIKMPSWLQEAKEGEIEIQREEFRERKEEVLEFGKVICNCKTCSYINKDSECGFWKDSGFPFLFVPAGCDKLIIAREELAIRVNWYNKIPEVKEVSIGKLKLEDETTEKVEKTF